jgi:hypothetical protein
MHKWVPFIICKLHLNKDGDFLVVLRFELRALRLLSKIIC